jgi:ATP-dependent Clp protease ATP-binding subunit ClpA
MSGVITPLIILWSILRWERKLGQAVLKKMVGDTRTMEDRVDSTIKATDDHVPLHFIDLCQLGLVARLAKKEARTLRRKYVGSEHLLLALVRCEDESTTQVCAQFDIDIERVLECLKRVDLL